MARGAGVVDEDVEAAEVSDRLVDHAQDLGSLATLALIGSASAPSAPTSCAVDSASALERE